VGVQVPLSAKTYLIHTRIAYSGARKSISNKIINKTKKINNKQKK